MRRAFYLFMGALSGCAATVPESEHRALLRAQQTEYEHRLRRAEEARQRAEARRDEEAEDAIRRRQRLLERTHALEEALAQKQRLWDESARGHRERAPATTPVTARALAELLGGEVQDGPAAEGAGLIVPLDLLFEPGAVTLKASARAQLPALARLLGGRGEHKLELRVGADDLRPVADGPGPFELSARQGAALAEGLVEAGLDPSLLRVTALGASSPTAGNEDAAGRARNRRLELRFEPVAPRRGGRPGRPGPPPA